MSDKIIIEKSKVKNKKYAAIINGKRINFGDKRYQQYEDKTPLKLYSNLDHHDKERRKRYYERHDKDFPKYSADWLSKKYLW